DTIIGTIREHVRELRQGAAVESVGAGFPGIVREGMIEESPNLGQLKGLQMRDRLAAALRQDGLDVPVCGVAEVGEPDAGGAPRRGPAPRERARLRISGIVPSRQRRPPASIWRARDDSILRDQIAISPTSGCSMRICTRW